ncbi:outer membrane protein assembly factor BamB family protein [Haloferax prahovense]|uniref:outer membrane protein assembly factor BamB family protein n=1 Tax=Haloferax prahovense TaxID=381852 RepID=UPI000679BC7F|nr:PQQ-binding-like beta-propeller repeat protein [Haloferax prahovense]
MDGEVDWYVSNKRTGDPVVAGGNVFHYEYPVGDSEETPRLVCRDASDGDVTWTQPMEAGGTPVVADGFVVAAGRSGIVAFRTSDGVEQWRHEFDTRTARASTVIDGTVIVSTQILRQNNRKADVRAYQVADGTRRWKRSSPKWQATVAASDDTIFSLSAEFQVGTVLTARDLADGSELWAVEFDDNGIPEGPVVSGDTVYVAPDDEGVFALDTTSGDQRWHYGAKTSNIVGIAASDESAYLYDSGRLRVWDSNSGTERWSVSIGDEQHVSVPSTGVGSETIYLGTGGIPADFLALSRSDGSERWRSHFPEVTIADYVTSGLEGQPAVVDGAVYANAADGLYAFGQAQ